MRYCKEYAALLDLHVDGELSPEEMVRVQEHLDECPACQAYVDDALAIRAAFPDVEDTTVPDGFADGVMARIRTNAAPKTKKKAPWVKVLVSLAACCAIVILQQNTGLLSGRIETSTTSAASSASESIAMDTCETTEEAAAEAAAESAPQAEEPQSGIYTYDTSMAASDEEISEPVEAEKATGGVRDLKSVYTSMLYLSADCAELLEDQTPVEESDTELRYELTSEEYETLLSKLDDFKIAFSSEDGISPTTDLILVIVSK